MQYGRIRATLPEYYGFYYKGKTMPGVKSSVESVANKVSGITGFHKNQCLEILQAAFKVFGDILVDEGEFRVRGFAHFKLRIAAEKTRKIVSRSFDPIVTPEQVYVRVEISPLVTKQVNKMYNEEDPTFRNKLRKKTKYHYDRSVQGEKIRQMKAERKAQHRQDYAEKRNEAARTILMEAIRSAIPGLTEEELQEKALAATQIVIQKEKETEQQFREEADRRLRVVQEQYHAWIAKYCSKGHPSNTGRTTEFFKEQEKLQSGNPETGV